MTLVLFYTPRKYLVFWYFQGVEKETSSMGYMAKYHSHDDITPRFQLAYNLPFAPKGKSLLFYFFD